MIKRCDKIQYRSKAEAYRVARSVAVLGVVIYRCPVCRFPDGVRPWHWGNSRPAGHRRR